jgi:hypothetical protein
MADAAVSLDGVKNTASEAYAGALSYLSSVKSAVAGKATECGTAIVDNKYPVAIGIVSAAVLSVFAYYVYKKYTGVQSVDSK